MSRESHERTFQSREIIWNTFESMARENDVPIDDLVNEAMEAYARVRGYTVAAPSSVAVETSPHPTPRRGSPIAGRSTEFDETSDAPELSRLDRSYSPTSPTRPSSEVDDDDLAKTASRPFVRPGRAGPSRRSGAPRAEGAPATPERTSRTIEPYAARPPILGGPSGTGASRPPPARPLKHSTLPPPGAPETASARRLVLTYHGRPQTVDKERFLIGRSKTQADLRLDDPNVSRQHAVIERVGSAWYIVDLGSTNGVLVAGERVARRALSDGDVIVITTHEIRCSVR